MIGHVLDRSLFKLDDRWSLALNEMDVTKTGIFRAVPPPEGHFSFYQQLVAELPKDDLVPAVSHIAYTGFHYSPLGLLFRSVTDKDFRVNPRYRKSRVSFYVSQRFEEQLAQYRFGRPIVMLEGVLDCEAFAYLTDYPFVMAYLTSGVNARTAAYISSITDKVLLVPDNDKAGRHGSKTSKSNLESFNVQTLILSTQAKDFGDVMMNPEQDLPAAKALLACYGPDTQLGDAHAFSSGT